MAELPLQKIYVTKYTSGIVRSPQNPRNNAQTVEISTEQGFILTVPASKEWVLDRLIEQFKLYQKLGYDRVAMFDELEGISKRSCLVKQAVSVRADPNLVDNFVETLA